MLASPSLRLTQSTSLLPVTHPHPNNRLLGNLEGCRPTVPLPLLYRIAARASEPATWLIHTS
jgi:hypothetical protein